CGSSSARYVVFRWLALLPPLALLGLLPLLVAGTLAGVAGQPFPWIPAVAQWALTVAPRVLLWSAIGLGFGTAGGGLIGGAGLAVAAAALGLTALDHALFRF